MVGVHEMVSSHSLILHHYLTSPCARIASTALRLSRLDWLSVETQIVLPKPALTALTGGYRAVPVLQVGADIFCNSELVLRRIAVEPASSFTVQPEEDGLCWAFHHWVMTHWFPLTLKMVVGANAERVPESYRLDREAFFGFAFDVQSWRANFDQLAFQWRVGAQWIEDRLQQAGAWLSGSRPGVMDASAFGMPWWILDATPTLYGPLTADFPKLRAWLSAMGALDGKAPISLSAADAVAIAQEASLNATPPETGAEMAGIVAGDEIIAYRAETSPDAPDRVIGRFGGASPNCFWLERSDPKAGRVRVFFPRSAHLVKRL